MRNNTGRLSKPLPPWLRTIQQWHATFQTSPRAQGMESQGRHSTAVKVQCAH
jgi:hypothetical protein